MSSLSRQDRSNVEAHRLALFCRPAYLVLPEHAESFTGHAITLTCCLSFYTISCVYHIWIMEGKPSKDDSALLERLNALKPSTVQLGRTPFVNILAV